MLHFDCITQSSSAWASQLLWICNVPNLFIYLSEHYKDLLPILGEKFILEYPVTTVLMGLMILMDLLVNISSEKCS